MRDEEKIMKSPPYKHILANVAMMTMAFAASLMYGNGLARAAGAEVASYLVPLTGTVDTGTDTVALSGTVHIMARAAPNAPPTAPPVPTTFST